MPHCSTNGKGKKDVFDLCILKKKSLLKLFYFSRVLLEFNFIVWCPRCQVGTAHTLPVIKILPFDSRLAEQLFRFCSSSGDEGVWNEIGNPLMQDSSLQLFGYCCKLVPCTQP